jgi:hypothetical protein
MEIETPRHHFSDELLIARRNRVVKFDSPTHGAQHMLVSGAFVTGNLDLRLMH